MNYTEKYALFIAFVAILSIRVMHGLPHTDSTPNQVQVVLIPQIVAQPISTMVNIERNAIIAQAPIQPTRSLLIYATAWITPLMQRPYFPSNMKYLNLLDAHVYDTFNEETKPEKEANSSQEMSQKNKMRTIMAIPRAAWHESGDTIIKYALNILYTIIRRA